MHSDLMEMKIWKPSDFREPPRAWIMPVEHSGKYAFGKEDRKEEEVLGSRLGRLLRVNVATVEFGKICGHSEKVFAISHVDDVNSYPLQTEVVPREYSDDERTALREASGLLPFLLWIAAEDHAADTNFVGERIGGGKLTIKAIDFGDSFKGQVNSNGSIGIRENFDGALVDQIILRIERLSDTDIERCVRESFDDKQRANRIIALLLERKKELRNISKGLQWP